MPTNLSIEKGPLLSSKGFLPRRWLLTEQVCDQMFDRCPGVTLQPCEAPIVTITDTPASVGNLQAW